MIRGFIITLIPFLVGMITPMLDKDLTENIIQCLQGLAFFITIIVGLLTILNWCKKNKQK